MECFSASVLNWILVLMLLFAYVAARFPVLFGVLKQKERKNVGIKHGINKKRSKSIYKYKIFQMKRWIDQNKMKK